VSEARSFPLNGGGRPQCVVFDFTAAVEKVRVALCFSKPGRTLVDFNKGRDRRASQKAKQGIDAKCATQSNIAETGQPETWVYPE
jgi:hypothetical protein